MKLQCKWNENMSFIAQADDHMVNMDASPPLGKNWAPTPKQLLLAGICGCTGMDVVALLKKYKQPLETFQVEAVAEARSGYPAIFKEVKLVFKFTGASDSARVLEAVMLSQTKYCSVSAMVAASVPISYTVELNKNEIGAGKADFKLS